MTDRPDEIPVWLRRLVLVAALPLGAWIGVVAAFQHLRSIGPVPIGALVGVVVLTCAVRLAALISGRRLAAVLVLVGWLVVTGLLVVLAPGGDVVLSDLTASYVYLLGGVIAPSTAASLPAVPLRDLAAPSGQAEPAAAPVEPG